MIGTLLILAAFGGDHRVRVEADGLALEVRATRGDSLFWVIDQLSMWSEFCHPQYREHWVEDHGLSEADTEILEKYAKVRQRTGWDLLNEVFFHAASLDEAYGVLQQRIGRKRTRVVRETHEHFRAAFDEDWAKATWLEEAAAGVEEDLTVDIVAFMARVKALYGSDRTEARVSLVLNPDPHFTGGSANGGVVLTEVARADVHTTVLLHEVFHLFQPELSTVGPFQEHEAHAYALAPGVLDALFFDRRDALAGQARMKLFRTDICRDPLLLSNLIGQRMMAPMLTWLREGRTYDGDLEAVFRELAGDYERRVCPGEVHPYAWMGEDYVSGVTEALEPVAGTIPRGRLVLGAREHGEAVVQALGAGLPVSPNVLAELLHPAVYDEVVVAWFEGSELFEDAHLTPLELDLAGLREALGGEPFTDVQRDGVRLLLAADVEALEAGIGALDRADAADE